MELIVENMEVKSKVCGNFKCGKEKLFSEFNKDKGGKYGLGYWCRTCVKNYNEENRDYIHKTHKKYRETHKEETKQRNKKYQLTNKDKCYKWNREGLERNREKMDLYFKHYREKNKESIKEKRNKYRADNKERLLEGDRERRVKNRIRERERGKIYYEEHKDEAFARAANRRAIKLHATPPWADQKAITAVYKECRRISKETGILHHVDHIIPLKGKSVTGLHVHWNLQIIPAIENLKKSNKVNI